MDGVEEDFAGGEIAADVLGEDVFGLGVVVDPVL